MISKNQIKLIRQLEQKKYRQREGLFVAEGPKVVGDLLRAGWQPQTVYATEEFSLTRSTPLDGAVNTEICVVTPDELRRISFLQHPQQVLALFSLPTSPTTPGLLPSATKRIQEGSEAGLLSIALDGVQDPGNLGTIIRIADWFGIETIYCSPDTVDAWSPKVVQATMGHYLYSIRGFAQKHPPTRLRHPARRQRHLPGAAGSRGNHSHGQRRKRHLTRHTPMGEMPLAYPFVQTGRNG